MSSGLQLESVSKDQYDDYQSEFDARIYLELFYEPVHLKTQNGVVTKVTNNLFDIFDKDIPYNPLGTALDFGCGPSIVGALCASRSIPNIVSADLVDGCRQEVLKWLNNDKDAFDWSPYAEYISNKEGIRSNDLEVRTRSAIKHVIPCDARADAPIGDSPPMAPYDVIMANLVIQTACPNKEDFIKSIRNICYYLKSTGLFIMTGVLNEGCYTFGDPPRTYNSLNHTKDDVVEFLKAAGMSVVSLHVYGGDGKSEDTHLTGGMNDVSQHYFVTSRKSE